VGLPGATCPQDRGRWPRQATGGCKLGHTMTQGPSRGGHAPPCVTLASLAHLISLGEGNDSA